MSIEAIQRAATNREAANLATADAAQAQRVVLLWQRPTIPDADIPEAIGVPSSLWQTCKANGDSPPLFEIGRRLFVRTADLRAWLDAKAQKGRPGTKKLRNRESAAA